MGLFSLLFSNRRYYRKINNAVDQVKHGIYNRLNARYRQPYGEETSGFLAAAVTNELFSEKPANEAAEAFLKTNDELLRKELEALREDEEIKQMLSYALRARMNILTQQMKSGSYDPNAGRPLQKLRKMGLLPRNEQVPSTTQFLWAASRFYEKSLKL